MAYIEAGFQGKTVPRLQKVFGRSDYQSYAYSGDRLVGVARAFSDGGDCAVICDVGVIEEYQGKGIGRAIIAHLLGQIPPHERLMLFATKGLEKFYQSYGFGLMTTGMCRFNDQAAALESGLIQPDRDNETGSAERKP